MNLTAMQDRLRQELLRRINRGSLSVSLLARQTGFGQSHISSFLRGRRQLSLKAMSRVMSVQQIQLQDLISELGQSGRRKADNLAQVPVVSPAAAMYEPQIRAIATLPVMHAPAAVLQAAQHRSSQQRKTWHRFVAVTASERDADAMAPILQQNALVLIDRHYTSLVRHNPDRENVYAVRTGARLAIRYLSFELERLILRPYNQNFPIELLDLGPDERVADLIVGRVVMVASEL